MFPSVSPTKQEIEAYNKCKKIVVVTLEATGVKIVLPIKDANHYAALKRLQDGDSQSGGRGLRRK